MASSQKLLYDRCAAADSREDIGSEAVCNGSAADDRVRPPAAGSSLDAGGTGPAQDADEAYSATVKVDATADSAAAAREMARIDGQRRALAAVIERLSGASEPAKPPKLDDKAITDMVASFEVANEHMSAVRYVADYTFHFRPSKVRRLVRVVETPPTDSGSKSPSGQKPWGQKPWGQKPCGQRRRGTKALRTTAAKARRKAPASPPAESGNRVIVILPVYQDGSNIVLWDDPNAWRWPGRSGRPGPDPVAWCCRWAMPEIWRRSMRRRPDPANPRR